MDRPAVAAINAVSNSHWGMYRKVPTDETPTRRTFCYLTHISVHEDTYALEKLAEVKSARNLTMILTPGNHDQIHPKF